MKKYVLTTIILFSFNILFAQRYNMSPEAGQNGLIIAGILFLLVALITIFLYVKKINADK